MKPATKDALLWGVVGLLLFFVLIQGYEIVQGVGVDLTVKAGASLVVAVATTAVTYVTRDRVLDEGDGDVIDDGTEDRS